MEEKMQIKYAEVSDIDRINSLFWELDSDSIQAQPNHFKRGERTVEYLSNIIADNSSTFLLAIVNENIIGFSLIYIKEVKELSLLVPCKYAYIQDFIITEEYRKKGYGTELLNASKKWAEEHACEYLRLSVMPTNEAGIRFYKKNGLCEQMITMECRAIQN